MPEPSEKDWNDASALMSYCKTSTNKSFAMKFAELRAEKEAAVKQAEQGVYAECKGITEKRRQEYSRMKTGPEDDEYFIGLVDTCNAIKRDLQKAADKAKGG